MRSELWMDLYQLTMAQAYWKAGMENVEAVFHYQIRRNPFQGGFCVACGIEPFIDNIAKQRQVIGGFAAEYLASLPTKQGGLFFEKDFLAYLSKLTFALDIDAVEEGTLIFPHEPVIRVQGPIIACQLIETLLLNTINFQSLIATKAARVVMAAQQKPVYELGFRRAQGIDGGISASRAAYIGGCSATSNAAAGYTYGLPVIGAHSHNWVMAFDNEITAFQMWAQLYPEACSLVVDTYATLEGVDHAIVVGKMLRGQGRELEAIRLDSGDLAWLSQQARRKLDAAGLHSTKIMASGDLDEFLIANLTQENASVDLWGVGTRLVTGDAQGALEGSYKLSAIRPSAESSWRKKIKISEQAMKNSHPSIQQVWRFYKEGEFFTDMVVDALEWEAEQTEYIIVDPLDLACRRKISAQLEHEPLLAPLLRQGERVREPRLPQHSRHYVQEQLHRVNCTIKRLLNPHLYPVGLEERLHQEKQALILGFRGFKT